MGWNADVSILSKKELGLVDGRAGITSWAAFAENRKGVS